MRRKDVRGQFRFASEACDLVPEHGEFLAAKSHRGLHLLAPAQEALALPLRLLREAYGPRIEVQRPPRGEPVMEVRIGLEKRALPLVQAALYRRGANASEEYMGGHYCVLRFEAAPAQLLGLPAELAQLTSGRATHQIVLRGYAADSRARR